MTLSLGAMAREPMVQFLAIGALLFAADRALQAPETPDRQVTVDRAEQARLAQRYLDRRGQLPSDAELADLARRWAHREILFDEAVALGLHTTDEMVRNRLVEHMRQILLRGVEVPVPEEAVLRAWFEETRARYDAPARLSFSVGRVDGAEDAAREAAALLNAPQANALADLPIYPFRRQERPRLVEQLPEGVLEALEAATPGAWQAVETPDGWQVVRLDLIEPGTPARFEDVVDDVIAHWFDTEDARLRREAVERLAADFEIVVEPVVVDDLAEDLRAVRNAARRDTGGTAQ